MTNIIKDTKRFLLTGEVCEVKLKDIRLVDLDYNESEKEVKFDPTNEKVSQTEETTIMQYLGAGMFRDLISEELFMMAIYNPDDAFKTEDFNNLPNSMSEDLSRASENWNKCCKPTDLVSCIASSTTFTHCPLIIDVADRPFTLLGKEAILDMTPERAAVVQDKILKAKLQAQRNLNQKTQTFGNKILESYSQGRETSSRKF